MKSDLTSLVRRAQDRDESTVTELVLRFQNLALGCAYTLLRDWHQAQDATQEAFLTAFDAIGSLQDPAAFAGWLRTIVRYQCHRMLRRYELDAGQIDPAQEMASSDCSPAEVLVNAEEKNVLDAAIRSLNPQHREIVAMFYLRGASHREVAAFLGIPVSTVNNRLHEARANLKRRLFTMVAGNIAQHRLNEGFAENIGRIISVHGPVVEARFDAPHRTDVFDILAVADSCGKRVEKVKVAQRISDGTVRAVAVTSLTDLAVGASITNVGGIGDAANVALPNPAMADEDVAAAVQTLGRPQDCPLKFLETGIKPIDLFCPLTAGGNIGLFGIQGVGRIVLVEELFHRLGGRSESLRMFYLVHRNEPDSVRGMLWQETGYPGDVVGDMQVIWLLCDMATDMHAVDQIAPFDATILCHPLLGARGLWPAVDPLHSQSVLLRQPIIDPVHRETAARACQLLLRARQLMTDPVLLEMLACRANRQAKQRVAESTQERLAQLSEDDRFAVTRARKLENFLTNPFFVAEKFNGRPGKFVPLVETIRGCNMIMNGDLDTINERALAYIGTIDEVDESR